MRSWSGSPCSSSPGRVAGAASSRRTDVLWSAWCISADTTRSPSSRPASVIRRHHPCLHHGRRRPARRQSPRPAARPARGRSRLCPAGRHSRGVRPSRRQPGRLLPQAPPARGERAGRDRPGRATAVDLARTAQPHARPHCSPHPPESTCQDLWIFMAVHRSGRPEPGPRSAPLRAGSGVRAVAHLGREL